MRKLIIDEPTGKLLDVIFDAALKHKGVDVFPQIRYLLGKIELDSRPTEAPVGVPENVEIEMKKKGKKIKAQ